MLASRQLLDVDIVVLVNLRFDWIEKMIDWIGDTFLAVVTSAPALFVDQDSPRFLLMRGMLGLILIVLVAYLSTMLPFRSFFVRCTRMVSNLFARKS
jgi:hypothetical protein